MRLAVRARGSRRWSPAAIGLVAALLGAAAPLRAQSWVSEFDGVTLPTFLALDENRTIGGTTATWLYVSEHGQTSGTPPAEGGLILRFNVTSGGPPVVIAPRGTGPGEFISPDAILVDAATGDLFIADRYQSCVQRITNTGAFVMKFGEAVAGAPDEMWDPDGLARDASGAIYVSEHGIGELSTNGDYVSKYTVTPTSATRIWRNGGTGSGPGEFQTPYGIAVVGSNLYICDGYNARVQCWDLNGNYLSQFDVPYGTIPLGLYVDASGYLWLAESNVAYYNGGINQIVRLTTSGAPTGMQFGSYGTGDGQFELPFDVAIDPNTNLLYVTDYNNSRVETWNLSAGPVPQVYFGTIGSDDFAAEVSAGTTSGTLIASFASSGDTAVVEFPIAANGSFSAAATVTAPGNATAPSMTFSGNVTDGLLTGTIAETGQSFYAYAEPTGGSTIGLAGLYTAEVPDSASGDLYLIAGSSGQAYALAISPLGLASGSGTVSPSGAFGIAASQGASISGTLSASTGAITATLAQLGTTASFSGDGGSTEDSDRLVNLSSLVFVSGGASGQIGIAGFVVEGTASKQVLVRAVGPGLAAFGVSDPLSAPVLQIFNGAGVVVAENTGWANNPQDASVAANVSAFPLSPGSADCAIVTTLSPGVYTAEVGSAGGSGNALVEIYDASGSFVPGQQLVNVSARGVIGTPGQALTAGFVVAGNAPERVLIRGIGPSLADFGVSSALSNTALSIYALGGQEPIAQNQGWGMPEPVVSSQEAADAAQIQAASTATGAFPLPSGSQDSAIIISLMPGAYTAVLTGPGGATGTGLVEVYEMPGP